MKYIIDIDGTICKEIVLANGRKDYVNHIPYMDRIERINRMYDAGHIIKYMTARGIVSGVDYRQLTEEQLAKWGAKYHELDVGNKPHYDVWIDDKAFWSEDFFRSTGEPNE